MLADQKTNGELVLVILGTGRRTLMVAMHLGVGTPAARRHLQRLERQDIVRRNARYTSPSDIYWEPIYG